MLVRHNLPQPQLVFIICTIRVKLICLQYVCSVYSHEGVMFGKKKRKKCLPILKTESRVSRQRLQNSQKKKILICSNKLKYFCEHEVYENVLRCQNLLLVTQGANPVLHPTKLQAVEIYTVSHLSWRMEVKGPSSEFAANAKQCANQRGRHVLSFMFQIQSWFCRVISATDMANHTV